VKEKERDTHEMCDVVYVYRVLPEENKEDSWKRFNFPIIYKSKTRRRIRRNGKDD